MESQKNFGHQHPLVFNQSDAAVVKDCCCSRCGEAMFGPSFSCSDECDFWLHKECAEAPEQINHPLHRDDPLCLLPTAPYKGKVFICNFCGEEGEKFVYHCSCDLDLHIKCALFTSKFPEINNFGDLKEGIIISEKGCLGCWEPLLDSASYYYHSLNHRFRLHQKCVELSFEIKYPLHRSHLLTLQFSVVKTPCVICHNTKRYGLSYTCSLCNFSIHIACLSLPSVIEGNTNQHPFTLISRFMTYTCDACGVEGMAAPYMSTDRNLLVHKKCISLPPVIKFVFHEHLLFHTYFIDRYHSSSKSKNWDCVWCLKEVNTNHGSYHCSECRFILHVNCATENEKMYSVIESVEEFNKRRVLPEPSYIVVERNEDGEATKIKHFTHQHNMILSDKILIQDYEFCDGCTLPILDSYYSCSECKYFLHKTCAEFPKTKYNWFHRCEEAESLSAGGIFKCFHCKRICNGFAYGCPQCGRNCCLRCVIFGTLTREFEGHQHPLHISFKYVGPCSNCGEEAIAYKCKICKEVTLCVRCMLLPSKFQHKCDEHLLALTYHEDNDYSETQFCDICEEDRKPDPWFYSCATCDTSAHPDCVLQKPKYTFIKLGKIFKESWHLHPVRFVKKKYYYAKCFECDDPCRELALECTEPTCDYIVHWECICSSYLVESDTGALFWGL